MKKQISVEVQSSGYDLAQATAKLAKVIRENLKDGFQPIADLPLIVQEAYKDFAVASLAVGEIKKDLAEDGIAFAKGINIGAYDILDAFIKE